MYVCMYVRGVNGKANVVCPASLRANWNLKQPQCATINPIHTCTYNNLHALIQLTVLRETPMQMKIFDSSPKEKHPMKKSPKLFTNSGFCGD